MGYSRGLVTSKDHPLYSDQQRQIKHTPLDVIYEDGGIDKKQAEFSEEQKKILQKYYLPTGDKIQGQIPYSRRVMTPITPDNGITFLNEDKLIENPRMYKTPPPPMWGEEESIYEPEPGDLFYDDQQDKFKNSRQHLHLDTRRKMRESQQGRAHSVNDQEGDPNIETVIVHQGRPKGSNLKKKIVYVYDSDSDDEDKDKALKPVAGRPTINSLKEGTRSQTNEDFYTQPFSKGFKKYQDMRQQFPDAQKATLPKVPNLVTGGGGGGMASRRIRTGAFQRWKV